MRWRSAQPCAVFAVIETPKLNAASFGTVVTIPVPLTVIVRPPAAEADEATVAAATKSPETRSVSEVFIGFMVHTAPRVRASHPMRSEHERVSVLFT